MRQLIAGNWKMNGVAASLAELAAIRNELAGAPPQADVLICPPSTLVARAVDTADGVIPIGGQDCHAKPFGAFTGDVSAEMLKDAGASAVIVGHSERRQYHGETSAMVAEKAAAAYRAGLLAIICVGETESDRNSGSALSVCASHIAESVPRSARIAATTIAYEPVWAIGTGRTPTSAEIVEMHAHIRKCLVARLGPEASGMRILYGGSVKPDNAKEILALDGVDGALIGGASLKAVDYLAILQAAPAKR